MQSTVSHLEGEVNRLLDEMGGLRERLAESRREGTSVQTLKFVEEENQSLRAQVLRHQTMCQVQC